LLFENCIELEGVQDNLGGEGLFPIISDFSSLES
jgi:hypothetical protein